LPEVLVIPKKNTEIVQNAFHNEILTHPTTTKGPTRKDFQANCSY